MDIGQAVYFLKGGKQLTRKGWNGNGMYLQLVEGGVNDNGMKCRDAVVMKTVDDEIVPWTCSQTDLLALDWTEV